MIGRMLGLAALVAGGLLTVAMFVGAGWERPPVESVQRGYRGLSMDVVYNPRTLAAEQAAVEIPEEPWPLTLPEEGEPLAGELYENVQVLGHLGSDQFSRLMQAMTNWVSPEQGCNYCHNPNNFADDGIYTKIVSRRMLQMTMNINSTWGSHVYGVGGEGAGVTCYTCHRGMNVPEYIWFAQPPGPNEGSMAGALAGQNVPSDAAVLASLPYDPFTPYFLQESEVRVASDAALPAGNESTIKGTEWTYSLMMHYADSLGVNCNYCHNSRAFSSWEQSSPQRVVAWPALHMLRDVNQNYMHNLVAQYPAYRLGPLGDAPKANCATCHQGAYQPLWGANMLKDYPSLTAPGPQDLQDESGSMAAAATGEGRG